MEPFQFISLQGQECVSRAYGCQADRRGRMDRRGRGRWLLGRP
jgi:hypothetical protein